MTLEPVVASEAPSPELADFTQRMWISAAAAVPLVILTMGGLIGLSVRDWIGHDVAGYLEFALATPIVLWAAWPFFQRGWASVVNRSLNMWTLISIGVAAAYGYSVVATFLPGTFPDAYQMGIWGSALITRGCGDRGAGLCGAGAGTARTRTHGRRDPSASGPCTQNRAAHSAGWHRI